MSTTEFHGHADLGADAGAGPDARAEQDVAATPGVHGVARSTRMIAAALSAAAGLVHLSVAPGHFEHGWMFGAFFLLVGQFQLFFAAFVLVRTTWPVALTGIVANLSVVLVYVASRTVGLPVSAEASDSHGGGQAASGVEEAGALDLATTAVELVLIGVLLTMLPARLRSATGNGLLLVGLSLWVLRVSGALG